MIKTKRRNNQKNVVPWAIAIIAIAAALYFYAQQPQGTSSREERLGMLWAEFHTKNSEYNIPKYFPDAKIIYSYNETLPTGTKYYYSPEIDKTIITCGRNSTLAICNGRYTEPLSINSVVSCTMAASLLLNIVNYTG